MIFLKLICLISSLAILVIIFFIYKKKKVKKDYDNHNNNSHYDNDNNDCKFTIKEIDIHPNLLENAVTFLAKNKGFIESNQTNYLYKYTIISDKKDYFSTFKINENESNCLDIITDIDNYVEIVIYSESPFKNPIYSCVNILKLDLSFLEEGEYSLAVFSINPIEKIVCKSIFRTKINPPKSILRKTSLIDDELRKEKLENFMEKFPLKVVKSQNILLFPSPLHTFIKTIENIEKIISKLNASAIYAIVPSYGTIISDIEKTIFHQFDSLIIYELKIKENYENNFTVIYTGIDTNSEVKYSPDFCLYIY